VWINATKGDFWQVVYDTTINVPDMAYGITILSATWAESQNKINVFVEIEGGGYLKAYENYTNLVAPTQSDGTMVWNKATTPGTVRVDVLMSKYSDFRSYANMTFYYTVTKKTVYFRFVNWFDNRTSFPFTDFLTYVDGELIVRDYAEVSGSTFNLTVTDYGGTILYNNTAETVPSDGLIVVKLKAYNLYFNNPGYDTLYVNLSIAGLNYPDLIPIPPLSSWGPLRLYNTSVSYTVFYKTSSGQYEIWEEGSYTVTSDYTINLRAHKTTASIPKIPSGGLSPTMFWTGIIYVVAAIIGTTFIISVISYLRGEKKSVEERVVPPSPEGEIIASRFAGGLKRILKEQAPKRSKKR